MAEVAPTVVPGNSKLPGDVDALARMPVPDRARTGEPLAASVAKLREPVLVAAAVGVYVTVVVQDAPTANVEAHVVEAENAPSPVTLGAANRFMTVLPRLVRMTEDEPGEPTLTWPKARLDAEAAATAWVMPVPLKEAMNGEPASLLATFSVPVELALEVGAKETTTLQTVPAARVEPQLVLELNAGSPEMAGGALNDSATLPVLASTKLEVAVAPT